jgi:hypothetical protein
MNSMRNHKVFLRVELRLRIFENRVLRRIFRRKRDEIIGDWRILHNEKLRQIRLEL